MNELAAIFARYSAYSQLVKQAEYGEGRIARL
jgi:hypothetical protein